MSVYIKGLQMPTSCMACDFMTNCDECAGHECWCVALRDTIGYLSEVPSDYRLGNCPLVEVPAHGDLIDQDEHRDGDERNGGIT